MSEPKLDPALWGMLRLLPTPGAEWPSEKRDAWLKALMAVLWFLYPEPTFPPQEPHLGLYGPPEYTAGD